MNSNFDIETFLEQTPSWYNEGKFSDTIFYSGSKIVRNLKEIPYPLKMKESHFQTVNKTIKKILQNHINNEEVFLIELETLTNNSILTLQEKKILPKINNTEYKYHNLYIFKDKKTFILTNHDNHLTIFSFGTGLSLQATTKRINSVLSLFDNSMWQISSDFNYLTNNLETIGTGFKAYIYLSIPGIRLKGKLTKIIKNFKHNGLIFTRFFNFGSLSEDIIVVTHKDSFSLSLNESVEKMEKVAKEFIKIEKGYSIETEDILKTKTLTTKINGNDLVAHRDLVKIFFHLSFITKHLDFNSPQRKKIVKKLKKGLLNYLPAHIMLFEKRTVSMDKIDTLKKKFLLEIINDFFHKT